MHIPLALLCIYLVAAPGCTSLPTKKELVRNTIHNIMNIAQTTLVRIKNLRAKLPVTPQIEVTSPPIEGLTSISHDLGLLDNELQSSLTESFIQIQADVSSLDGMVRSLAATMDCRVPDRPAGEPVDNLFPDSRLHLTLTKVKCYLEKLLLHKDKLKVC